MLLARAGAIASKKVAAIDAVFTASLGPIGFGAQADVTNQAAFAASLGPLGFGAQADVTNQAAFAASLGPLGFGAQADVTNQAAFAASLGPLGFGAQADVTNQAAFAASLGPLGFGAQADVGLTAAFAASLGPIGFGAVLAPSMGVTFAAKLGPLQFAAAAEITETETATLLAALSGTYSTSRKTNMNTMIAALKAGGYWNNIVFMIWPGANTADSFINWKSPGTLNATNSGLVVTPFSCYQGNGSSQFASSNVVPNTHLPQNSHTLAHGCWNHQIRSTDAAYGGGNASSGGSYAFLNMPDSDRRPSIGLSCAPFLTNVVTGGVTQIPSLTNDGIWLQSRVGAGSVNVTDWLNTRNKVSLLSTVSSASASRSLEAILLAARKRSSLVEYYSNYKYSFWAFMSQGYGKTNLDAMTDIFKAYQNTLTTPP